MFQYNEQQQKINIVNDCENMNIIVLTDKALISDIRKDLNNADNTLPPNNRSAESPNRKSELKCRKKVRDCLS